MKFSYKARTKQGSEKKGTIEASSRRVALDILEKYGLYVTALKKTGKVNILNMNLSFVSKVSHKDVVIFTRQFGVMLKSAIPPVKALKSQVSQTRNSVFREKILQMAEGIETGSSLSQVFAVHPKIFDSFYVSIIKSGEATGKVADSLGYLADHLERDYNLEHKVRGAMIYPGFIIAVFIAAFFLVMLYIVPKLTDILEAFSGDLPISTRILMFASDFTRKGGWILMLLVALAMPVLYILLKKFKKVKIFYDRAIIKIPLINKFFKKVYLTRFCENLSVLIASGLPITQALNITKGIISNTVYKEIIAEAEKRVSRGEKISVIFEQHHKEVFPFVTQMIATGEETGRLESILMDVVGFYRAEIERTTDNLTTILEPVLILVLGIGIAILAVSIFIPLFNIGMGGGM